MATQGPPPQRDGLDLATLFISAIASAAAAYLTSKIWAPGTLVSAAMTPVIVALVKEMLRKPTEVITNVVPQVVPTPSRWTRTDAGEPGLVAEVHDETPPTAVQPGRADEPPIVVPHAGGTAPVKVYSTRGNRLRWRIAVITGLLGFVIAVAAFTVPELLAGQSLGGSHKTTIFGGPRHHKSTKKQTKTTTSTTSTQSTTTTETQPTETTTVTQTQTVTTPQPETTTPTAPTTTPTTPTTTTPPAAEEGAGAEQAAPPG